MRLITLEEHFTTRRFQEAVGSGGELARQQPELNERLLELGQGRIDAMNAAGINVQVLSFTGFGLYEMQAGVASDIAINANDLISEAIECYPGRFGGFATLALQNPAKAAKEFERCVERLGFRGAMIDGTVGGKFLDRCEFTPIFEVATALDVPIYLHPAPPPPAVRKAYTDDLKAPFNFLMSTAAWGWHVETGLHSLRLMISGLFDRFPTLKIIIGHMGENLPYSIVRADTVLCDAGLKLQRSPIEIFQQNFWITTSGYFSVAPVLCAREVIGSDRILLSVDYPFSRMEHARAMLDELKSDFSSTEIEGFAYKNAAGLLGI